MYMETANLGHLELSKKSSDNKVRSIDNAEDDYQDFEDNNYFDNDDAINNKYYSKEREAQYELRMIRMASLFAGQPRFEEICRNWKNEFLLSWFTRYTFNSNENDSANELHEKGNDLEYVLYLCGSNLTYLDVRDYPISEMMPIINDNCPNLETLYTKFKVIMSQDFENVFSNMSKLGTLSIEWECENSTLPMTLVKSLERIGETLKCLELLCTLDRYDTFSPDSLTSVFPRLSALNRLYIYGFGPSQLLLQSIGEIKNLADLTLMTFWPKKHPMFDTRINMYPIGNLKNLEKLFIFFDYGVRDEFLINLCNNAKKLRDLHIIGTNISDIGMSAIDNLQELEMFNLGLTDHGPRSEKNEFITDESIQCLFNKKLWSLKISNCIKITDKGVFKLFQNLPNLDALFIENTKVTDEAVKKIYKLKEHCKKPIIVYDGKC